VLRVKAGRLGTEPFDDGGCGMARYGEVDRGEEHV